MTKIPVSVINQCTVLHDTDIQKVVAALQIQVSQHFAPVWGVDATLTYVPKNHKPAPKTWWLVMLDTSDEAGALGYHDLTPDGLPIGKVFAKTDLHYGASWSVTMSHELLEMLADPSCSLCYFIQPDDNSGTLYCAEVGDPVEADHLGYKINGIQVSDFIYPAWFEPYQPKSTQFDYMKHCTSPLQILPGGYMSIFRVNSSTGWSQITDRRDLDANRPRIGSRREKRMVPRDKWLISSPK